MYFTGRACGGILDLYVGYDKQVLAKHTRDLTTFQMSFGVLRLVTLPMEWTNSVLIFHDNITYILRDKIPKYTLLYIDNVPIWGPATRYELPDSTIKILDKNPGIRR